MGLDVYLHRGITGRTVKDHTESDNFDSCADVFVIEESWSDRSSDLQLETIYETNSCEWFVGYPYSNHSRFRQKLADVAHGGDDWQTISDGPFHKFINFADNEGTITWTTAGELAKDFVKYDDKFKKMFADDEYACTDYDRWKYGFEQCAIEKGIIEYR